MPLTSSVFADPVAAQLSGGWTFAITNDATIKLAFGAPVVDTGLSTTLGNWSQITLTWSRFSGVLQLYVFDVGGNQLSRTFSLPNSNTIFVAGGRHAVVWLLAARACGLQSLARRLLRLHRRGPHL